MFADETIGSVGNISALKYDVRLDRPFPIPIVMDS